LHEQPALRKLGHFAGERYPVTERLARRGLYLPSGLDLDESTIDRVVGSLEDALAAARRQSRSVAPHAHDSPAYERADSETPFGPMYAEAYDALYRDKDFASEVNTVGRAFERFGAGPIRSVLDVGCGTGIHASLLAERGYEAVGVDRSPHMLAVAKRRTARAAFVLGDMTALDVGRVFDAVLVLFAALGYQTEPRRVSDALRHARRHLNTQGLLIFDVWYGPSVVHAPPAFREKIVRDGAVTWTRRATPAHDPHAEVVRVAYELERRDESSERRATEVHPMRYFFPLELELLLDAADFELLSISGYDDFARAPDLGDYMALVVARARPLRREE
jgi:SAM-dependent methyltransferase